ncbi:MAG: formate dehydrogenase accessory sulfurtransferase FdhD [Methanosarcinales archaeon]|nr:formate dehydrogenase accessory sulfurtransferase FdhD [Methanosarcinales archaeon]
MFHQQYNTVVIDKNGQQQSSFTAAIEETFDLYVNNARIASILASPAQLEQLAVGYLVCEGIVRAPSDITGVNIDNQNRIFSTIIGNADFDLWFEIRSSGCIGVNWEHNEVLEVESGMHFSPEVIRSSLHHIESDIHRSTRGTHAACLIDRDGGCVARAVDVGRHNAIDKAIGQALMDGVMPGEHFILSTGRQPGGMVLKAARAGIPMVVTKTAPLNSGIEAARRTGICLVGFATIDGMTVFANDWRLDE